tara:strand:- start:8929 stop:10062 length:1134 start_codon:yes stop_codon:yes gene_type:complete
MTLSKNKKQINWVTSSFLIGTALIALTAVPAYIWSYGLDWFQASLFLFYFIATGLSITLGYHRLFSHLAFKAKWPVRLFVLIFGAASFENSALDWTCDHRRHHKHVDHDDDPYDITKGFFYAHMGWLLFRLKPKPPMDNVKDLKKDPLIMWQYRYCHWIGAFVGFVLPAILGWYYGGTTSALGAFLIAGVARVVFVQQMTFLINSACHYFGSQPYSTKCTARDSGFMALFTFGEGYHNFHHEFQHDYRNGVKFWQFDPTKWCIWLLSKVGLASDLRRVSPTKILLAEMAEAQKKIKSALEKPGMVPLQEKTSELIEASQIYIQELSEKINANIQEIQAGLSEKMEMPRRHIRAWRKDIRRGMRHLALLEKSLAYASA